MFALNKGADNRKVLRHFLLFTFFYRKKVEEVGFWGMGVSHFLGPLASVKANLDEV